MLIWFDDLGLVVGLWLFGGLWVVVAASWCLVWVCLLIVGLVRFGWFFLVGLMVCFVLCLDWGDCVCCLFI